MKYKALEKFCDKLLTFVDKETDWKINSDTTNSQVITEFMNRNEKLLSKLIPSEGNPNSDTEAVCINTLLTAGDYLGSLVGKEVSVEPGFIYECRGFNLNENGSGTLYGKNGFCTFGSYKAVRPCR